MPGSSRGATPMIAAPHVTYKGLPGNSIELITNSSLEFTAALGASADPTAVATIQPILPYSAIVQNKTSRNLMQISVRTYLTDESGKTRENTTVLGRSGYPASWIASPGEMILITPPEGSLSTVLKRRTAPMSIPEHESLAHQLATSVNRFSKLSEVEITIDSVIFDDGEVIGEDRLGNQVKVNAMNAAEADILREMSAASDITAYLKSVPEPAELYTRRAPPTRENMSDEQLFKVTYDEQRYRFAQGLLNTQTFLKSQTKSEDAFRRHVEDIERKPYPTAWRKP